MTQVEYYPIPRIRSRPHRRNTVYRIPTAPRNVHPPVIDYPAGPLRVSYAAATPYGSVATPSTLIQALTLGAWLGEVFEVGAKLLVSLGLGWMLLRIRRKA